MLNENAVLDKQYVGRNPVLTYFGDQNISAFA